MSVFLRSPDKGFWACLGDIPPDMPRQSEKEGFTRPAVCGKRFTFLYTSPYEHVQCNVSGP